MSPIKLRRFTLIELIIAIALMVMIASIVAMTGMSFYNGYDSSVRATAKLKEYMAIDNVMDSHIRNTVPFKWKDDDGTSRLIFNGDEHELHFTTLRRSYGDRPGALLFVRIFVEEDKLIAAYSPYPRLPWIEEEQESMPWTREIIAENVEEVTFAYAEKSTEVEGQIEFLETYLEEENSVLPLGIKMTVRWLDGTQEQWFRRVSGSSANSSFGERTATASTTSAAAQSSNSAASRNTGAVSGGGRSSGRNNSSGNPGGAVRPGRGGRTR